MIVSVTQSVYSLSPDQGMKHVKHDSQNYKTGRMFIYPRNFMKTFPLNVLPTMPMQQMPLFLDFE